MPSPVRSLLILTDATSKRGVWATMLGVQAAAIATATAMVERQVMSVLRGTLGAVDHEDVYQPAPGFERQPQLFLQSGEDRRSVRDDLQLLRTTPAAPG